MPNFHKNRVRSFCTNIQKSKRRSKWNAAYFMSGSILGMTLISVFNPYCRARMTVERFIRAVNRLIAGEPVRMESVIVKNRKGPVFQNRTFHAWCPGRDSNSHGPNCPPPPQSGVSTNSTTWAFIASAKIGIFAANSKFFAVKKYQLLLCTV